MNETGLIIAEVAFLVLLYAFVWSIVRSSSRQLRSAQPPPPAAPAAPAAPAPVAMAPVAPPVPEPAPPVAVEPIHAAATVAPDAEAATEFGGDDDRPIDLAANLDPRLIVDASPVLEIGRVIPLEEGVTIGRSDGATISLADQFVSHMHARIMRRGAYHWVHDLGSTNGTYLNDRRIDSDAQLKVHDALRIGQTVLRYEE